MADDNWQEDEDSGYFFSRRWQTLYCGGCKQPTLRKVIAYYNGYPDAEKEPLDVSYEFFPPRIWHTPPSWLNDFGPVEAGLKELLEEVYTAANDSQPRLLALGVRTVLDTLMNQMLGGDYGPFETKLQEMVNQGHIGTKERDSFNTIIEAGSAASHRGYMPNRVLLGLMLKSMDNLVYRQYIANPMPKTFSSHIPPKPSRAESVPKLPKNSPALQAAIATQNDANAEPETVALQ
jgi:hypothetical protein